MPVRNDKSRDGLFQLFTWILYNRIILHSDICSAIPSAVWIQFNCIAVHLLAEIKYLPPGLQYAGEYFIRFNI
ncbi:hypothetical protein CK934_20345 [Chitinophaga sp. MD30]|nr:hypothetical protein CK934_20345 [Chitinophaga sp. MD30]